MRLRGLFRPKWIISFFVLLLVGAGLLAAVDHHVGSAADGRCHNDLARVPARPVALVLGTSKYIGRRLNRFYTARIEAVADLYKAGKVRAVLISGDNSSRYYDEPSTMRDDLVAKGVPANFITLDYAGFRTLDSIVRARLVFGQPRIVVVSQPFHCRRALYLADAYGLDAVGYTAQRVPGASGLRVRAREVLARLLAFLDVNVLNRQPKFLGKRVEVKLKPE